MRLLGGILLIGVSVAAGHIDTTSESHHRRAEIYERQAMTDETLGGFLVGLLGTSQATRTVNPPPVLVPTAVASTLITTGLLTNPVATAIATPLMVLGNTYVQSLLNAPTSLLNGIDSIIVPTLIPSILTQTPANLTLSSQLSTSTLTITAGDLMNSTSTTASMVGDITSTFVVLVTVAPSSSPTVLSSSIPSKGVKKVWPGGLVGGGVLAGMICLLL